MIGGGHARLWVMGANGQFVLLRSQHNDIMAIAKDQNADLVRGHPLSSPIRAFAVGSSSTAVTTAQTQLGAEVTRRPIPQAGVNTTTQRNLRVGTEVTFRQVFGPGLDFVLREMALFGDILELSNPSAAPVVTPSESGGTLTAGTYTVVTTWANGNGETQMSPPAMATITGTTGKIDVVVPPLPEQATTTRVFAAPSGTPLLSGTTVTTTYAITAFPAGAPPPAINTAVLAGIPNSGRMINRVVIADATILTSTVFVVESKLIFS